MLKKVSLTIILFLLMLNVSAFRVFSPTCEMKQEPLAISSLNPRFGWQLSSDVNGDKQLAYQIILKKGEVIIWNSGKINSDKSQLVPYQGKNLEQGERYNWTVKVWNAKGNISETSSYFETAPDLSVSKAQWVGAITREDSHLPIGRRDFHGPSFKNPDNKAVYEEIDPLALRSILLRKEFNASKKITKALVYVSGLGHYALYINGEKVSRDIFTPVWSDYDKTVYYNTYQVDSLLLNGKNAMGIELGNGFYNAFGNRYRKLWVSFGPPTLYLELNLTYADGTTEKIVSDTSWKYDLSPTIFNDIYGGEDYDATLEQEGWNRISFNDSAWKSVVNQGAPKGDLRSQELTSVRINEMFSAVSMSKIDSSYVFNMGQNLSGFPTIKVIGKKGDKVKLTLGELLNSETGLVSQKQSGGPHTYTYTLKGDGIEEWHPQFTYYGYQYIQVDGVTVMSSNTQKPSLIGLTSNFIYNSTEDVGDFESSNEMFNKVHVLIKNAVKSNMQSVFTDCPHREKLGWLEEIHLVGPGLLYNWDLTQFYPKEMQDMKDAQSTGGLIPTIVPQYVVFDKTLEVFHDSPEWGIASIMVPWLYYQYYGDDALIREYFDVMKGYVNHMTSRATDNIVSHGLGDWYDYGEHRAGFSKNSPVEVSATAHYYWAALHVAKAAKMMNKKDDERKYRELASDIRKAYNDKFFDKNTFQYGTGSQFCNAISIYMDLVDSQYKKGVMDNLKADIAKRGNRLTTGDVGNRYLFQALAQNGENELMYLMHNHEDTPGYGFQLKFGTTTLTEQWDPRMGASWNHFMMGQIDEWFFASLAGLKPDKGFKEFIIEPQPVGDLTWVKVSHKSLYGQINIHWTKENGIFTLKADIPMNTKATVVLPNGKKQVVGSGQHEFKCNY